MNDFRLRILQHISQHWINLILQQEGPSWDQMSRCFCLTRYGQDPDGDGMFGYITGSNGIIFQVHSSVVQKQDIHSTADPEICPIV